MHSHLNTSMIVFQIHINCVTIFNAESDPPIFINSYAPRILPAAL